MKFKNIDENKKKNLKIYLIFLISFLVFSIYGFMKFNGNTKEKINNSKSVKCNLEDESNSENESKPIE